MKIDKETGLARCPFCGSRRLHVIGISEFAVECMKCTAVGPSALDEEAAIAKWNTRYNKDEDDGK